MKSVFISSTSSDLKTYRDAAAEVCLRLMLYPIDMKYFPSMGAGATEGSKRKLEEADVYIGIFAHRYGYIEAGYDQSVTELEFDYAGDLHLERLCFLVDPHYPWPHVADDENLAYREKLIAFKNRINRTLIRAEFTTIDDFKVKLMQSLIEWMQRNPERPGDFRARHIADPGLLVSDPDDLIDVPRYLFGRDRLLAETAFLLAGGQQVLLQGFGGVGKTALALTIAATWIRDGHGSVLWLQAGSKNAVELFQALGCPLKNEKRATVADEDIRTAHQVLKASGATLLVLDDCWNGSALYHIRRTIPSEMRLLVTARQRYAMDKIYEVSTLELADALQLLSYQAGTDYNDDPDARRLCQLLGDHPFALEIAGNMLKVYDWTPQHLIDHIHDAPHQLSPADYNEFEREGIQSLLDASLDVLDTETQTVFLAFGAFTSRTVTPELLGYYLDMPVMRAINQLQLHSLVRRKAADAGEVYEVHDLAYSYAHANQDDAVANRARAIAACLTFVRENAADPSTIELEINNLLGTAENAWQAGQSAALIEMMCLLCIGDRAYFVVRGHTQKSLLLTREAINQAQTTSQLKEAYDLLRHLGHYYFVMQHRLADAHDLTERALALTQQMGDRSLEGRTLITLATLSHELKQGNPLQLYEQAEQISRETGDEVAHCGALQNLGYYLMRIELVKPRSERDLDQFRRAARFEYEAAQLARRLDLHYTRFCALTCLGGCACEMGDYARAEQIHQEAYDFASEQDNEIWQAEVLEALGEDRHYLHKYPEAQTAFNLAFELWHKNEQQHRCDELVEFMHELEGHTYVVPELMY